MSEFFVPLYLVDQSVMSRYRHVPVVREQVDRLAERGILCSAMVTIDEARFSARGMEDLEYLTELYHNRFHRLELVPEVEEWVHDIRSRLWTCGKGRSAQTTDVLIAATAIHHQATVVHHDKHFAFIGEVVSEFRELKVGVE